MSDLRRQMDDNELESGMGKLRVNLPSSVKNAFATLKPANSETHRGGPFIDIDHIRPSATQPRRALPSNIRHRVYTQGRTPNLNLWFAAASEDIDWTSVLNGSFVAGNEEDDEGLLSKLSPAENSLVDMLQLAVSIRRDGLTNPITVAPDEEHDGLYIIETGERRWLAFNLLNSFFPDEYKQIPCKIVESVSIWRQATENTIRQDLTAIGQARQFALLLMDRLGSDQFKPLDSFDHEREFYAQVADGNVYRIPRGAGGDILNAMGLKNTVQLRFLRQLLNLSNEDWQAFDDQNTPLFSIRSHIAKQGGEDESVSADTVSTGAPAISDRAKKAVKRFYQAIANGEVPTDKDIQAVKRVTEVVEKKE